MLARLAVPALALLLAVVSPPAVAGDGGRRPPRYRSPAETILLGHPGFHTHSGTVLAVTVQEFLARCAVPATNGLDAAVFRVPRPYRRVLARIRATGRSTAGEHDLDLYLFDGRCELLTAHNGEEQDERGIAPPGTAWVVLHNFVGGPVEARFTLVPLAR